MKNKSLITKPTRAIVVISLMVASFFAMAAKYETLSPQPDILSNHNPNSVLQNESWNSPSILDSMQQEKNNAKKRGYSEVLDLLKQKKLDEAGVKLAPLIKQSPESTELYNLQALLETLKKDTAAAIQNYQKAISLDKNNILANLGLSKLALDSGDLTKAKDYASKTLAINGKLVSAYLLLADIAYSQKNYNEVESVLTTALAKNKGDLLAELEVIQNLGKLYAAQKQPEKMLVLGEDLAKRYPNDNKALSLLAGTQIINNKKSLAEDTLTKIIAKDKTDSNDRLLLANLLSENAGKEKDVINLLDEAIAIAPNKPQAFIFKTAYLIKLKHLAEALELAKLTDKKFPDLAAGKLLLGDIFMAEQKLDQALDNYQESYKTQANDKVLFTITDILIAQKKLPDAIKLLNTELAKNSNSKTIHFKLASIYQQQNDFRQAEKHYNTILAEQPNNALALNNLAWIYSQENNPKSLELAKKAFSNAPESGAIADTYGYILIKQNQQQEGLKILEKAASLAPTENDIQFHLAEAYSVNEQQAKAIEILNRIVKDDQNFMEKSAALNLLDKLNKK
jgi:putative PEP-CTERM system TPR-repeat lipoprotein